MSLLSSRAPGAKFPKIGAQAGGTVTDDAEWAQQRDYESSSPMFWDDGNPRMQLVITVDTGVTDPTDPDDLGDRTIYVKGQMMAALKQALRRARAKWVLAGDTIQVTFVGEDKPRKLYSVQYAKGPEHDDARALSVAAAAEVTTTVLTKSAKPPALPTAAAQDTPAYGGNPGLNQLKRQAETTPLPRPRVSQDDEPPF